MRRRRAGTAVAIATLMLVVACSNDTDPQAENGNGNGNGSVSIQTAEPDTLYPLAINTGQAQRLLYQVYSPLALLNERGEALYGDDEPRAMAESIESDDALTWTITLKEGWTFHNGDAVTSDSFVNAWNWGAYQPNGFPNTVAYQSIDGFEDLQCSDDDCAQDPAATELSGLTVIDEHTFEVVLANADVEFPVQLSSFQFFPLPEEGDPSTGGAEAFRSYPIGNGPFEVTEPWTPGQHIQLARYENYGGEPAGVAEVEFRVYTSNETAYNDMLAGNLDILPEVPVPQIPSVDNEFDERVFRVNTGAARYLIVPLYVDKYDNVDLRRALSLAIDREAITDEILGGAAIPAHALVPETVSGSQANSAVCEWCEYDPERAQQLFTEAGGEGPLHLQLASGRGFDDWMEAIGNMWRQHLGVDEIEFHAITQEQHFDRVNARMTPGPFRSGFSMQWPTQENYLSQWVDDGRLNFGEWESPEYNRLVDEAQSNPDPEQAADLWRQAERVLLDELPLIPVYWDLLVGVHSERVDDIRFDAAGRPLLADVTITD